MSVAMSLQCAGLRVHSAIYLRSDHRRYEGCQRRTARPIPLVVVRPDAPLP